MFNLSENCGFRANYHAKSWTRKYRVTVPGSVWLEQKLLEPQIGRNTYMMKRVRNFWKLQFY